MPPVEIIEKRTRNSKTHSLGGRKFSWDGSIGSIHYEDNGWQEIDNYFESAVAPWDWQMLRAGYHVRVKEDFTASQIIEFEKQGETVQFQPMALEWTNDLDQIQPIAMPHDVSPVVTNPEVGLLSTVGLLSHQGTIRWDDAYGEGIDFEWKCSPTRLIKTLEIENLNNLIAPEQYILDGGNPVLRLNLIFDPSKDVDIFLDGEVWDKKKKKQTFKIIEFRKDGETLWGFMPLRYWDSGEDNEGQSVATLEKRGNKLYISIRVPYSWLQNAVFPVFVDTDIDEDIDAGQDDGYEQESTGNMFMTLDYVQMSSSTNAAARGWGGFRWLRVAIAQGSEIDVCYVRFYVGSTSWDDFNVNLHFQMAASPGTFSTAVGAADISGRDRTSNSLSWIQDSITVGFVQSASLVDELQEVVDDYTTTTLVMIVRPNQDTTKVLRCQAWEHASALEAEIHIEYTEVAPAVVPRYPAVNFQNPAIV